MFDVLGRDMMQNVKDKISANDISVIFQCFFESSAIHWNIIPMIIWRPQGYIYILKL